MEKISTSFAERNLWALNNVLSPKYMVTMVTEIDATNLSLLREKVKNNGETIPSYTSLVIKAAAITMQNNPQANRVILGLPFFKRLYQCKTSDISVAVEKSLPALPGTAFASIIENAIDKSLSQITEELRDLAVCNETNNKNYSIYMKILNRIPNPFGAWIINGPSFLPTMWKKYRGSACWVNAPSKAGADLVFTTWPWPLSFSFGVVKKRPIVIDDKIEARLTMPLVMVFDRRIMGGGPAGRIFAEFKDILQNTELKQN